MSAVTSASAGAMTPVPPEREGPGRYWLDNESFLARVMLLPAVIYIVALVGVPLTVIVPEPLPPIVSDRTPELVMVIVPFV